MGLLSEKAAARPPKRCSVGRYYHDDLDDEDRDVFDRHVEEGKWTDLVRLTEGAITDRSLRRHAEGACSCSRAAS